MYIYTYTTIIINCRCVYMYIYIYIYTYVGDITRLTLLVYHGLVCFMCASLCRGSYFAAPFDTFEQRPALDK